MGQVESEQGLKSLLLDDTNLAPVAQLDRASDYGSEGHGFDSFLAHHENPSIYWGFCILVSSEFL
jgi:hypothetical protein